VDESSIFKPTKFTLADLVSFIRTEFIAFLMIYTRIISLILTLFSVSFLAYMFPLTLMLLFPRMSARESVERY